MDVRLLLGIGFAVFVVIGVARLFLFLFGLTLGQYSLFIALFVFLAVVAVISFMVKKLLKERNFTY